MSAPAIVEFPASRINVPAGLRRLASRVENGEYGEVRILAVVIVGGAEELAAFCYGKCNDLEVSGAFARASVLSGACINDFDAESNLSPEVS